MSMSTHIIGFRPPDEKWQRMKEAHDSCTAAGLQPPDEVMEFFDWEAPDDSGISVDLEKHKACSEYNARERNGFEIDLSKLPDNITKIRFFNSY